MLFALPSTGLALAWLAAIFVPLEWAFPAWQGQRRLRLGLATDLAFTLGQYLVFSSMALWVIAHVEVGLDAVALLGPMRAAFGSQPLVVQAIEAVILGDLLMYWGHRLQHRSPLLWRTPCTTRRSAWTGWRPIASIRSTGSTPRP